MAMASSGTSTRQPESDLVTICLSVVPAGEPMPVRLMNTIFADRHGVYDALTTTRDLRTWLEAVYPSDKDLLPSHRDVQRFRTLRDGLRCLAALVTKDQRAHAASATADVKEAVDAVNRAVTQAPALPQMVFHGSELRLATTARTSRVDEALSSIAAESAKLLAGESKTRLRACYAPGCVLYFVKDHARREWCSTACGNRARAARHYLRHHKAAREDG